MGSLSKNGERSRLSGGWGWQDFSEANRFSEFGEHWLVCATLAKQPLKNVKGFQSHRLHFTRPPLPNVLITFPPVFTGRKLTFIWTLWTSNLDTTA